MAFQSTVNFFSGFSVPGELWSDQPHRAQSFILNSASAAYNVVGATAYTVTSEGVAAAGGTGAFAGILFDPKSYALFNGLTPTLVLPNQIQADLLTMGSLVVTLPGAAAIGDVVIYDTTTGALSTITPGTSLPSGKLYAQAFVDYFPVAGAGLAVITVNPTVISV